MTFDLTAHLGTMSREVRSLERDGKPAQAVVASRIYDTDAADLWDALTNKERIPRWFAPVSGELKLGGTYQVENNAGGTITECVPHKKIVMTWEFMGGMSWVTLTLSPTGAGTRLELEHFAFVDPHWEKFGSGAVGVGWDLSFMGLSRHLEEPGAQHPAEAAEGWFASQEAKDMIRVTSEAWGRAEIAGGGDREAALSRAERTRKFFSGEIPASEM